MAEPNIQPATRTEGMQTVAQNAMRWLGAIGVFEENMVSVKQVHAREGMGEVNLRKGESRMREKMKEVDALFQSRYCGFRLSLRTVSGDGGNAI